MSEKNEWTLEEKRLIDEHFVEGMRIGTCTEPADRATTEACIREMYAIAGHGKPQFTWARSPFEALSLIHENLPETRGTVPGFFAGGENAYWVMHYVCGGKLRGTKYEPDKARLLALWDRLIRASGWWFPFERGVVCCDRPDIVKLDDRRVLHCVDGPARRHRDGVEEFFWHGTSVPREWIVDKAVRVEDALLNENVELRRCAAEILGWAKILDQVPHRVLDRDPDPFIGTLIAADLPDAPDERFLLVRCGTGRDFALVVTRREQEFKTAREANAGTYGLKASEFFPEGRS